eukprot:2369640-Karenia_brevis.AAC.1
MSLFQICLCKNRNLGRATEGFLASRARAFQLKKRNLCPGKPCITVLVLLGTKLFRRSNPPAHFFEQRRSDLILVDSKLICKTVNP